MESLIESQSREPAPRRMHAQFFHQLAFASDAVQITEQQNTQQQLGIDRQSSGLAVDVLQLLAHKLKTDVLLDQPREMSFGNLIFQTEIIEKRF